MTHEPPLELERALAADEPGVERAEELADGLMEALRAWESTRTAPSPTPTVWCLGPERVMRPIQGLALLLTAVDFKPACVVVHSVSLADKDIIKKRRAVVDGIAGSSKNAVLRRAAEVAADAWVWQQAERLGLVVPHAMPSGAKLTVPGSLVGKPFAGCPNPFEPLLGIFELGYVPDHLDPNGLWIVAPPLD